MSASVFLSRLLVLLMIAVTGLHLFWTMQGLRNEREVQRVYAGLRRLAALAVRNFPDRNLDPPELFWKSIGRDSPMVDAWGTEYRVMSEGETPKRFYWRSAGPDTRWGTRDDLSVEVPFVDLPAPGQDPEKAGEGDAPPSFPAQ